MGNFIRKDEMDMNRIKSGTRLYINITNGCNVNCPFCCMYSGTNKCNMMSFKTFKKIIDKTNGSFELQLEGGEPLINKNIFLFIEYAISTDRCTKVIVLTNGILLNDYVDRFISIAQWNKIPFEIKISVNYYLLRNDENHLKYLSNLYFAIKYIPYFNMILNVRKRRDIDEWIDEEIKNMGLSRISHSFYLQSYGKMSDTKYDKPTISQNIESWFIYASDGKCFNQDLIARSEHEKDL